MLGRFRNNLALLTVQNVQSAQQQRCMATLKEIYLRRKAVESVQKITQSMKMVSASKYARAEKDLKQARPLGDGSKQFYEKAEIKPEENKSHQLLVAITSDRGLCGAVHTNIVRQIRAALEAPESENIKIVCVGERSRLMLHRKYGKHFLLTANEVGRLPPTFTDASRLTNAILKCEYNFNSGKVYFNRFKSIVSYDTTSLPIFSMDAVQTAPKMTAFDSIDDDVLQSYLEFSLASIIYYAMKEGACSEQSSRVTSMDKASKNAGEVIKKLKLQYNRTRQAVITRELIEIISGAAAL